MHSKHQKVCEFKVNLLVTFGFFFGTKTDSNQFDLVFSVFFSGLGSIRFGSVFSVSGL